MLVVQQARLTTIAWGFLGSAPTSIYVHSSNSDRAKRAYRRGRSGLSADEKISGRDTGALRRH
jgi:hypothetical protein